MAQLSNGDFTFTPSANWADRAASVIHMADLNNDARYELVLSGDEGGVYFEIYELKNNIWEIAHDTIPIHARYVRHADFDGDTRNELLIAGKLTDNSDYVTVITHEGDYHFTKLWDQPLAIAGQPGVMDLNADGFPDAVLPVANNKLRYLQNQNGALSPHDTLITSTTSDVFLADMNSDDRVDLSLLGTDAGGDFNLLHLGDNNYDTLNNTGLVAQNFGDQDRDGDLDVAQIVFDANYQLIVFRNDYGANEPPSILMKNIGLWIYDRLFIFWDRSQDDHTAAPSISYDLSISTEDSEWSLGNADLLNRMRLLSRQGNTGTNHFALLNDIPVGVVNYFIQPIDDALYAGQQFCHGSCGPGGGFCGEVVIDTIKACKGELLQYTSESPETYWFSFAEGFVAKGTTLDQPVTEGDTIFSFELNPLEACAKVQIFTIEPMDTGVKEELVTKYVCEGQQVPFSVEPGWTTISWSSTKRGNLGSSTSINFIATEADTVQVELENDTGCKVIRQTAIVISKPEVELAADAYQILKGQSVQLHASGGESFAWQPPTGLNSTNVADPIASPIVSTEYTVTVSDSIGCTAQGKVTVLVELTAFIPNLFTPNADGRNDELKIYGLGQSTHFRFRIMNREGSVVYESSDPSLAASRGWDGTRNGVAQPAGVYYWDISGEMQSGRKLMLNGKTSGSIVLVR
ncbi:MAG: T9SS type B sorting domain-containing protein [Bacteroidia bacterium]|nr:T9SS type B sorting domain-containing protein [Bacteroidia bacterium]